ncbi:MAG: alpha-1,4-glucan--maltose-1-phosphate maltosyltransferase, partial [Flavobacteriales bacterium]
GHTSLHPQLGTLDDFKKLINTAEELGIEIAMDFALQCAPDHPYVKANPQWLKQRPDGTIQYAENPPKKYQDIYPIYFESEDWKNLWKELLDIALYWVEQGIRVFRVDNPHTKPLAFWEWLISEVKKKNQDVLFLSEAFTKPKLMQELARLGFTQSYTYYTWRNSKHELVAYMNELTQGIISETFRPNFWPNTPDILPWALQNANEHTYLTRYFLAATLSSNVGVYGPVYEFMEHKSMPGKEEYADSEKYEVRHWDWKKKTAINELYSKVNKARKEILALQRTNNIRFCNVENEQLIAFCKFDGKKSRVVVICSLDSQQPQSGHVHLTPWMLGMPDGSNFRLTDALSGQVFDWYGEHHFVALTPQHPYHLFVVE